jgi:hypothetical protein
MWLINTFEGERFYDKINRILLCLGAVIIIGLTIIGVAYLLAVMVKFIG